MNYARFAALLLCLLGGSACAAGTHFTEPRQIKTDALELALLGRLEQPHDLLLGGVPPVDVALHLGKKQTERICHLVKLWLLFDHFA